MPTSKQRMPLGYNMLWVPGVLLGLPVLPIALFRRKRRATFFGRLAWPAGGLPVDGGGRRPIWIHALSVGEVASAEPIVDRLRHHWPDQPLVFSTSTYTGMQTARRLFSGKVRFIFYFPYDLVFSVERVVRRIQPSLVLVVETDLWPNFLFALKRRAIPILLVNARLSRSTFRGYRLFGRFTRRVLGLFEAIGAQSQADAARFVHLGASAERVVVTGNVKFDRKDGGASRSEGQDLRTILGIDSGRAVLLLGSTHPGEEDAGVQVFLQLKEQLQHPLLIVAPRDPGRASTIEKQVRGRGLSVGTLSSLGGYKAPDRFDVLVVDTIGLLQRLYAVADVAFVGGSLVRAGGHNPLEPAAFAKPILFGPDMSDFAAIADQLVNAGAAVQVRNGGEWCRWAAALFSDPDLRGHMGRRALGVFESNKGAVDRTLRLIRQCRPADRRVGGVSR